ncbi:ROK family protein [Haploplasma axanthum]|uniref:N-acetyl-D-glucosamine kinase n=1 Tax=Haploplasma axanthum TaxID=29552 RepID=A0A449BCC4_HAPAX|nr:ROK family protein [Haploplasma axanthum]VEU80087.1 N-acetyl-D-glucosamine kinase [Haploplasma axanthum]
MKTNIVFVRINNDVCNVEIVSKLKIFNVTKRYKCSYHDFIANKDLFIKCDKVVLFYEKKQSEYIKQIETELKKIMKVLVVSSVDLKKLDEIVVYYEYDKDVSGKIIIGNKVFEGGNGFAGSFGNLKVIDETGFNKSCMLSDFTSVFSLKRLIEKYSYLYKNEFFNNKEISIKQIYENYKKNDLLAKKVLDILLEVIAESLENLIHIIDPNLIILNFNLGKYEKEFIGKIKEKLYKNTFQMFKARIERFDSTNKNYLLKIVCGSIYEN